MFQIKRTTQFKKDYKRILKRNYKMPKFEVVLNIIISGDKLPAVYKDHLLMGEYDNNFECHIENDWLLIYKRNEKENKITLVRTGTHSDLF